MRYSKNKDAGNPFIVSRCYFCGAIEHGEIRDNWRVAPKQILTEQFGIAVFDPFDDPKQQWVPDINKARENKDHEKIVSIAKSFVRKDLALVDRSDFLVAYLPYKVPTTGTHHEIINSNNAKKPTLLVTNCNDIGYIPLWYFGFIPTEFMFPNWEALYEYLESVKNGEQRDNNRWSFTYGDI